MRVVLDTNVLIGALITSGTPPDALYQAWLRGEIELITSAAQIAEMAEVVSRPYVSGSLLPCLRFTPPLRGTSSRTSASETTPSLRGSPRSRAVCAEG